MVRLKSVRVTRGRIIGSSRLWRMLGEDRYLFISISHMQCRVLNDSVYVSWLKTARLYFDRFAFKQFNPHTKNMSFPCENSVRTKPNRISKGLLLDRSNEIGFIKYFSWTGSLQLWLHCEIKKPRIHTFQIIWCEKRASGPSAVQICGYVPFSMKSSAKFTPHGWESTKREWTNHPYANISSSHFITILSSNPCKITVYLRNNVSENSHDNWYDCWSNVQNFLAMEIRFPNQ